MKNITITLLTFLLTISMVKAQRVQDPKIIFSDNFESYEDGAYLAGSSSNWTTWGNEPSGLEDPLISTEQFIDTKSVKIIKNNDLVYKLGNKTSGEYEIDFSLFIKEGCGGYYNIQHYEKTGIEWAFNMYFSETGSGYIERKGEKVSFDHANGEWFSIKNKIFLDKDSVYVYLNDKKIDGWKFSSQTNSKEGEKQLGSINFFGGGIAGETIEFFIDNFEYKENEKGNLFPKIKLSTDNIDYSVKNNSSKEQKFTITNEGTADMNYHIYASYLRKSSNELEEEEEELTYNRGVNHTLSFGKEDDLYPKEVKIGAYYPVEMIEDYIGMEICEISVFTHIIPNQSKVCIWEMGEGNTPGPGKLIVEQEFEARTEAWNSVKLDKPVLLKGEGVWVGFFYSQDTYNTKYPGIDDGPVNENGDWFSSGGTGWTRLKHASPHRGNWCIKAKVKGDAFNGWLSIDTREGNLEPDNSKEIAMTAAPVGLSIEDDYTAEVKVISNDRNAPLKVINVKLDVLDFLAEDGRQAFVKIYPTLAKDFVKVESNIDIYKIQLIDNRGKVVSHADVNGRTHALNVKGLPSGMYFIKYATEAGEDVSKIIIK
ncbi:MAG: T9SS type A sorting domain-containing protein [Hyphomicrobiales bacterium]